MKIPLPQGGGAFQVLGAFLPGVVAGRLFGMGMGFISLYTHKSFFSAKSNIWANNVCIGMVCRVYPSILIDRNQPQEGATLYRFIFVHSRMTAQSAAGVPLSTAFEGQSVPLSTGKE
jgi:hypothetical protein